ncbi:hypothetical protein POJ06DRAFT_262424 [Lipomyces tetrasporus]|uniref:Biogenesis of lysosome-related organelles complex 1 subunit 1 n=1 Tax=Lipomyces tetrasporus TaxID=54092 RepID=A0AAD7VQE0_9ASCO|nr:uncharacterized protein POJ06DRAFT_262424 [Lipomyces tetrasporus]KAJ8097060.1 hypothetical protein POJ06DRAFT_262424 [Lipomyces tetrasporus]
MSTPTATTTTASTAAPAPAVDTGVLKIDVPRLPADIRKQFYRDLQSLTHYVDRDLRQRITSVHANAKHISAQSKHIRGQTMALVKETRKWEETANKASEILKEAGDVQNWAEILEVELSALEESLRIVESRSNDEPAT